MPRLWPAYSRARWPPRDHSDSGERGSVVDDARMHAASGRRRRRRTSQRTACRSGRARTNGPRPCDLIGLVRGRLNMNGVSARRNRLTRGSINRPSDAHGRSEDRGGVRQVSVQSAAGRRLCLGLLRRRVKPSGSASECTG